MSMLSWARVLGGTGVVGWYGWVCGKVLGWEAGRVLGWYGGRVVGW